MFKIAKRTLRILDFDTECRPMHYSEWRPESQITAIAWSWVGSGYVDADVLQPDLSNEGAMLVRFLEAYDQADMVSGHYIRKHDLPLLNDTSLRLLSGPISQKLAQDTKLDFRAVKSLGLTQDNLSTTLGLTEEKHHMTGADWRLANSLSHDGQHEALRRVIMDVKQHKAMTQRLLEMNALHSPQVWKP